VLVGGELTIEMLDLQFNPNTKFYAAPMQMKANNGLLIVDDFGRQRISPTELLNRWVVPLDRGIDSLTLAGGKKIEIPFDLFVIFSTNLDPASRGRSFPAPNPDQDQYFVTPEQFRRSSGASVCSSTSIQCGRGDDLIRMIGLSTRNRWPLPRHPAKGPLGSAITCRRSPT
jgi:hypothetical protein